MDYSKLTNDELDKLIAKKRGYVLTGYGMWTPPGKQENFDNFVLGLPSFTTDPRYAMELEDELRHNFFQLTIIQNDSDDRVYIRGDYRQRVDFKDYKTPFEYTGWGRLRTTAEAWLQWRENE